MRLGHYEILEKLGSGGMGEVYKARDSRLERLVAVKVLPANKVADAMRKQRFIQEARAASALNHPNIVTIYDIPEEEGVIFLVMEYVHGKSLETVIPRRGVSVNAALKYAVQIADALAAAHAAGIVHRDIKPSNIMVTEQGRVKVLDFGLAKLLEPAAGGPEQATRTATALAKTAEGTVVGSAPYMSPEQAEGKPVDARSDIFSFGAVLYEMVTGQRAFSGDSWASTVAAVLKSEPRPAREMAEGLPRELQRIIARCLRKDLGRRSQSIAEVKLELEELIEESESGELERSAPAAPGRRRGIYLAAALALVALSGAGGMWLALRGRQQKPSLNYRLRQMTRGDGINTSPALSPDGKLLAYASDRAGEHNLDIWVQQIAGGDAIRLTRNRADEANPRFSPDGSQILFARKDDGIYAVPSLGGTERLIAKGSAGAEFSPDGQWIAYSTGFAGSRELFGLYVVPSVGGAPRKLEAGLASFYRPLWSPDSKHLLVSGDETSSYTFRWDGSGGWYVIAVDGGRAVKLAGTESLQATGIAATLPVAWLSNGKVVFGGVHGGVTNIWQVLLDSGTWALRGAPQRVTAGSGEFPGAPSFDGLIPFATGSGEISIYALAINPQQGKVSGALIPVVRDGSNSTYPSLTRDAGKMVYVSNRLGTEDIWLRDLKSGAEAPLVATRAAERRGLISPDGSQLAFQRLENGSSQLYLWPLPAGPEQKLCTKCGPMLNASILNWSPDGKSVIMAEGDPQRFEALEVATGQRKLLAAHSKYAIHDGQLSPDGRWLVFKLVTSATVQPVFVAPVRDGAPAPENEWVKITGDFYHSKPFWSPGGDLVYYYSAEDTYQCLYARRLDPLTRQPQGDPLPVRHFHDDLRVANGAFIGYGLAADRLYIPLETRRSNIWLAEPEKP